jgi:hypothetical protein
VDTGSREENASNKGLEEDVQGKYQARAAPSGFSGWGRLVYQMHSASHWEQRVFAEK